MNRQKNAIECELYLCPDSGWLQRAWIELEARSEPNFFLSWLWIGSWFECFVDEFYVIEARRENEVIGLGIIVPRTDTYYQYLKGTPCYLHRVGDELLDQAWIEFNDFLMVEGQEQEIRHEMISMVMTEIVGNGKFVIGASHSDILQLSADQYAVESTWETLTYQVDLEQLRNQDKMLCQMISRSARYQINRSIRRYEEYGEVTISTAESVEEALVYFALAAPLHVKRWGDQLGQSGFRNPHFIQFHEALIRTGVPQGHIHLHKVMAGNELIAIMYNFHWQGNITFYLSALNYEISGDHLKPGMVSHFLLINRAMEEGFNSYDFMGGIARYKETFANLKSSLSVYEMRKSKELLALKNKLRYVKQQFFSYW
ncbi:GNAT family N-acetyltransferase [Photobacterium nomapromontoriensis]|uniref:GNAT family N-acetyltransferase n=1 Tax=Photobacterium nomapromontoriensis TaxID=2910237 RepID=UPI003D13F154